MPALGRAILASNSIYAANFKGIGQLHFSQYVLTSSYNKQLLAMDGLIQLNNMDNLDQ